MTKKTVDESKQFPRIWRKKLTKFLKELREENPELPINQCPSPLSQENYESDHESKENEIPDIGHMVRLFRSFISHNKPLPNSPKLQRLFILLFLTRIEALKGQTRFKEYWVTDNSNVRKPGPKKDPTPETANFENSVKDLFPKLWGKYGEEIEKYFINIFEPIEENFRIEIEETKKNPTANFNQNTNLAPTLANFPEAFNNLVIIVGDYYGEINRLPKHHFELFRESASNTNLMYLLQLGLPKDAIILSDHLLLQATEEQRIELLFDKNILVLGSPKVNVVSRFVNLEKKLIFNFVYKEIAYSLSKTFYDDLEKKLGRSNPSAVKLFYKLMDETNPDLVENYILKEEDGEIDTRELKRIKQAIISLREKVGFDANNQEVFKFFKPIEMFSPLAKTFHNLSDEPTEEFAVISLGENPWLKPTEKTNEDSPKHSLIAICGINRVSTAIAVKVLLKKDALKKRPLGGLIRIDKPDARGLKEIIKSEYRWLTPEYKSEDILQKLDHEIDLFNSKKDNAPPSDMSKYFNNFNEKDLENYRRIVSKYIE